MTHPKNRTIRRIPVRILALLLLLAVCLSAFPGPVSVQAADYIAANHTKSNGCPYYIMVNRSCNTVTIYTLDDDGYYTVPYKAMICSTGRSGHRTPTGTFSITSTKKRWCYMVDGSYGQYSSQFYGNYLFHSVCYSRNSCSSLMTSEYNALGDYASLGCVRLQVADAKWIYDNCASGTKVTIYDGTDPGPLGKPAKAVAQITSDLDCGWEPTDPDSSNPWRVTVNARKSSWCTGDGTVSGGKTCLKTESVTLTAQADEDSVFSGWYNLDGYLVSDQNPWTFTASESVTYEALFEEDESTQGTWVTEGSDRYYELDGVRQTGFVRYQKHWYYLDPDSGKLQRGWKQVDGSWYYLKGRSGVVATGWTQISGSWYYMDTDGVMQTGWQTIDGRKYHFNSKGVMAAGWKTISNRRYYFNSKGVMLTGWHRMSDRWYYFSSKGIMQTGWQTIGGKRYHFNSKGVMATGWKTISSRRYYFNSKGVMLTGWHRMSGRWYHFNSKGVMQTGWHQISGKWYYFSDTGVMAENKTLTISGTEYTFDANGVCGNYG